MFLNPPSPEFSRAFRVVLLLEGVGVSPKNPTGYANHPKDPGGETRFGICHRSHPDVNITTLTLDGALAIYWRDYWLPCGAQQLPWPLQCMHADAAVNQGVGRAAKFLQGTHDPEVYMTLREAFYQQLAANSPAAAYWLPAWEQRLRHLRALIAVN